MDKTKGCVAYIDIRFTMEMIPEIIILAIINLVILCGNSLVIAAVITTRKLRTNTNTFIVSLACSDILLGIFVIPFSASLEILKFWPFGDIWCSMWLSIDVFLCTASILNLCAISFDRYLAVTKPMQYSNAMSRRRSKVLVATVWILSVLICIPPLLGWNDKTSTVSNVTLIALLNTTSFNETKLLCNSMPPQCELTSTQGYRIYSALGSFYIPMFLMVFFYCRIYKAAVKTTSAIRSGVLKQNNEVKRDNDPIILRVHRGNSVVSRQAASTRKIHRMDSSSLKSCSDKNSRKLHCFFADSKSDEVIVKDEASNVKIRNCLYDANVKHSEMNQYNGGFTNSVIKSSQDSPFMNRKRSAQMTCIYHVKRRPNNSNTISDNCRPSYRNHISKMLKETKATKTVAIIVGVFVTCWFPFFTIYLIEAFGGTRVPSLAFSVMFWLGYCNSMLNPFIYGMFSRDFRWAFRRIFRRVCTKRTDCIYVNRHKDFRMKRRNIRYPVVDFESSSDS